MDDAQMEIDRLIEDARREQNAAWYGPAFYSFTPLACDGPNEQCFSFRLAYADAPPTAMRASLEEALTYHGCHLDKVFAAVVDGHLVCSAVSQQGKVAIKKARALLRRWQEWGHLTYITACDRSAPVGPRKRHGQYSAARHGRVGA